MPETAPLVVKGDREEHWKIDHCFYCQESVGTPHKDDCVMWRKKVKVRVTVELEIETVHSFTKEMIENHRNGSCCADKLIDELQAFIDEEDEDGDYKKNGCLCGYTHWEVIPEFSGRKLWEREEPVYEYAAMRIRNHDRVQLAWPDLYWTEDKEDVEELVEVMNKAGRAGYTHSYVVAKRVKAGEIEF